MAASNGVACSDEPLGAVPEGVRGNSRHPLHLVLVVVMGVTASGKTTLGTQLAASFTTAPSPPFQDADGLHPPENVAKLRAGIPLTDDDRWPWLEAVASQLISWGIQSASVANQRGDCGRHDVVVAGIVACSALKRSYRDFLRARLAANVDLTVAALAADAQDRSGGNEPSTVAVSIHFAFCSISQSLAQRRAMRRADHFVNPRIVESQFSALEVPTDIEMSADRCGRTGASMCPARYTAYHQQQTPDDAEDNDSDAISSRRSVMCDVDWLRNEILKGGV